MKNYGQMNFLSNRKSNGYWFQISTLRLSLSATLQFHFNSSFVIQHSVFDIEIKTSQVC